jgi:uncharacterized protein YjbI with pentapeptide repeats
MLWFAIPFCMVGIASGQIYRMNGELISGTEDIVLGPGVDLSGWDLGHTGTQTSIANLSGFDLTGADFSGAVVGGESNTGSDFTDANLSDASMFGVDGSNANFDGADLSGADLEDAFFRGADFSNARLPQLQGGFIEVRFVGAQIQGTDFDFGSVLLLETNFANADLTEFNHFSNSLLLLSSYNQWTRFPDGFQLVNIPPEEFTLQESPIGDFDLDDIGERCTQMRKRCINDRLVNRWNRVRLSCGGLS